MHWARPHTADRLWPSTGGCPELSASPEGRGGCAEPRPHPPQPPQGPDPRALLHLGAWHKQTGASPAPVRLPPATASWKLSTGTLHPASLPVREPPPREDAGPNLTAPHPGSLPLGKGAARLGGGISLLCFPCIVRAWVIEEILQVLLLPSGHGGSPAPFPPLSAAGPYPRSKPRPLKIVLCQAIVPTPSRQH